MISPGCLKIPFNWTKLWFWHFIEHGVVLFLWTDDAIPGNGHEIEGQKYFAEYQWNDGLPREVLLENGNQKLVLVYESQSRRFLCGSMSS